jgi:GalNAc-alpha-(1->4)-GalNAc-alpha-(1->3)-diNAcBac-PP-undecaprenol alpha-1,4-N-acetyl-D-galactosaminyltransferase
VEKRLSLVIPSLSAGGMERVIVELATSVSQKPEWKVDLVVLTSGKSYYNVPPSVNLIKPSFEFSNKWRVISIVRTIAFLRNYFKEARPFSILSFGGKYNAFVLLASRGLNLKVFVSDRSRPGISYGKLQDFLNPRLYRKAAGIIAQTKKAKDFLHKTTGHQNIQIIGNPIRNMKWPESGARKKIVLNVGRFIKSKQQKQLVDIFDSIDDAYDWRLLFVGDGPEFESVVNYAKTKKSFGRIEFIKHTGEIDKYYNQASIFAFTSVSEGFPNVLGEALGCGMICIAYDCCAGPSDLIKNYENGFLIPENRVDIFTETLREAMINADNYEHFRRNAMESIKLFDKDIISERFLDFITDV